MKKNTFIVIFCLFVDLDEIILLFIFSVPPFTFEHLAFMDFFYLHW